MATDLSRLSVRLLKQLPIYNETHEAWKLYIHDHKANILANATLVTVDPENMGQYIYRPDTYLVEQFSIDKKYVWIFLFINDFANHIEFDDLVTTVYIPDPTYINGLLQTFKSVIAAGAKR